MVAAQGLGERGLAAATQEEKEERKQSGARAREKREGEESSGVLDWNRRLGLNRMELYCSIWIA